MLKFDCDPKVAIEDTCRRLQALVSEYNDHHPNSCSAYRPAMPWAMETPTSTGSSGTPTITCTVRNSTAARAPGTR
jgi:hypothetical protein